MHVRYFEENNNITLITYASVISISRERGADVCAAKFGVDRHRYHRARVPFLATVAGACLAWFARARPTDTRTTPGGGRGARAWHLTRVTALGPVDIVIVVVAVVDTTATDAAAADVRATRVTRSVSIAELCRTVLVSRSDSSVFERATRRYNTSV